jgi:hypothetical protein
MIIYQCEHHERPTYYFYIQWQGEKGSGKRWELVMEVDADGILLDAHYTLQTEMIDEWIDTAFENRPSLEDIRSFNLARDYQDFMRRYVQCASLSYRGVKGTEREKEMDHRMIRKHFREITNE